MQPVVRNQQAFVVPSLTADGRGIAIGPVLTVVLPTLSHLVGFLRGIGRSQPLAQVLGQPELGRGRLGARAPAIYLRFKTRGSHAADRVAAVARLHQGQVYTGDARHAVRYRDGGATLGYDADTLIESEGQVLYDAPRRRVLHDDDVMRFDVLLRRLALVRDEGSRPPTVVLVRAPEPLARRIMRRLARRDAKVEVAQLDDAHARSLLLRVRDCPVELFPLLQGLPRVTVFRRLAERIYVELGRAHPLDLGACAELIPGDAWLFFSGDRGEVAQVPPIQSFVAASDFDTFALCAGRDDRLEWVDEAPQRATWALRLAPRPSPQGAVAGRLVRGDQDMRRLHDLVYRAPEAVLRGTQAVLWDGHAVLLGEGAASFPLGAPLRLAAPNLFVGLHEEVRPAVSASVLGALVPAGHSAVATVDGGLQWLSAAARPLSRWVVANVWSPVDPQAVDPAPVPHLEPVDFSVFRLFWERR